MALFIGMMSGTSLDGIDGVLVSFPDDYHGGKLDMLASAHIPFDLSLRQRLMALQLPGENEIEREALAANRLATLYAENVRKLLEKSGLSHQDIRAIGVHKPSVIGLISDSQDRRTIPPCWQN